MKTTIERHKSAFKRLYDAYKKAQDIEAYLDSINSDADILTRIPRALPKAYQMAKRGASPHEFTNETARSLNPFFGFIPDPNYQWTDQDVITPLYKLGQSMRTAQRRRTDNLLALQPEHPHQQYTQIDEHHILASNGLRYEEVFGQNMRQQLSSSFPPRRRPTEDYQVIEPSVTTQDIQKSINKLSIDKLKESITEQTTLNPMINIVDILNQS